jgi:hypothetical protein
MPFEDNATYCYGFQIHTRWQAMLVQMLRANGEAVKPEIGEPDLGLHRPLEILQFRGPDRDQL